MIIPTPEYDPMFADDGTPFRTKMIRYIQREFGDLLGGQAGLLRTDEGLAVLARVCQNHGSKTSPPARAA